MSPKCPRSLPQTLAKSKGHESGPTPDCSGEGYLEGHTGNWGKLVLSREPLPACPLSPGNAGHTRTKWAKRRCHCLCSLTYKTPFPAAPSAEQSILKSGCYHQTFNEGGRGHCQEDRCSWSLHRGGAEEEAGTSGWDKVLSSLHHFTVYHFLWVSFTEPYSSHSSSGVPSGLSATHPTTLAQLGCGGDKVKCSSI
jgi:hypothetical protein